jgi:hypothetical protein
MENLTKIISSFNLQDELNPKLWEGNTLKPKIREKLLEISYKFIEYLNVDLIIGDITMTGSLANYNWSEYSDVDLHILADFKQFSDSEKILYEELFKLKKTLFNVKHQIKIFDFDVELYVQNESEIHTSSGVYSILNDEWLIKPTQNIQEFNPNSVKKKSVYWMSYIDTILSNLDGESFEVVTEHIDKLKEKIKKYRASGLDSKGEYSDENLVFKALRRNGYIEKVFDFYTKFVDKELSLKENRLKNDIFK